VVSDEVTVVSKEDNVESIKDESVWAKLPLVEVGVQLLHFFAASALHF